MATTTLYDIAQTIQVVDEATARVHKKSPTIVEGMIPRTIGPNRQGLVNFTPEEILSIRIEPINYNGVISGYQRPQVRAHVRRIARAIQRKEDVGEVLIGLDGGNYYIVDGAHRALAHIMLRRPLAALVKPMTFSQRQKRFESQRYALKVSNDIAILGSTEPISVYIKRAIASPGHPFHEIVGMKNSESKISPSIAFEILGRYSLSLIGASSSAVRSTPVESRRRFEPEHGDELGCLLLAMGTKTTNPLAYRPATLKALTDVAVLAIRRGGRRPVDIERWCRHMPTFNWQGYAYITRADEMRAYLARHWNKRIAAERKISVNS